MRGLDTAGNPFRGRYRDWDRWALEHAKSLRQVDWSAWNTGELAADLRMIFVYVDADGYPVPILETAKREFDEAHQPQTRDKNACSLKYMAFGVIPQDMLAELKTEIMLCKARYVHEIPAWLAENPPQWAVVLPDGNVLTKGGLGSGRDFDVFFTWRMSNGTTEQQYHRYDPSGKLAAKLEPGVTDWYKLFWPDAAQALSGLLTPDTMVRFDNGCVLVQRYDGSDVLALFNYDGTELPVATDPRMRDQNVWNGLLGMEIPALYEAQQRLHTQAKAADHAGTTAVE